MTWWQILLVFAGIPAAMFLLITVVVLRFTTPRVPDGLLRADERQDESDPAPEGHHGSSEDAAEDD